MDSVKEIVSPTKTLPSSSIFSTSKNYINQFKNSSKKSQDIKNLCVVYKNEPKKLNASRRNSDTIIQSSNSKSQYLKLPLSRIESKPINESTNNIPSFLSSPTSGQLSPNESLFIYDTFLRPPSSPLSIRSNSSTSSNSPNQSQYSLNQEKSNIINNNGSNNSNCGNVNNASNLSNASHKSSLSLRMVPDLLRNFNSKFLFKRHSITVIKDSKKLSKSNQTMFKVQSKSNIKNQMASHIKLAKSHSNSEDILKSNVKVNRFGTEKSSSASQEKNVSFNDETIKTVSESFNSSFKSNKSQKPKRSRSAPNNQSKSLKTINNVTFISSSKTKKESICNKLSNNSSSLSSNPSLPCRYCEKPIELPRQKQFQSTNN
jgi:hypothetical protein